MFRDPPCFLFGPYCPIVWSEPKSCICELFVNILGIFHFLAFLWENCRLLDWLVSEFSTKECVTSPPHVVILLYKSAQPILWLWPLFSYVLIEDHHNCIVLISYESLVSILFFFWSQRFEDRNWEESICTLASGNSQLIVRSRKLRACIDSCHFLDKLLLLFLLDRDLGDL